MDNKLLVGLAAGVTALALVFTTTPLTTDTTCATETTSPVDSMAMVSGTIRWVSSTQWIVLDDAGHTPTGISSVTLLPDRVRVNYNFTATKVSSLQVTPDEAFSSASVRVGASVGLTYADIYFYMGTSQTPVNPALLSKSGANVWLTGFFNIG
jgi:hypothetical protein